MWSQNVSKVKLKTDEHFNFCYASNENFRHNRNEYNELTNNFDV